jgi:hypothetical protein
MRTLRRFEREELLGLALLLGLVTFLYLDVLLLGNTFYERDILSYQYPLKKVTAELVRLGELPYWNPYLAGGQPLAANPAYQLFYPPNWLTMILPFQLGFRLLMFFHIYLAAVGMYLLLRILPVRPLVAFIGAFCFVAGGTISGLSNLPPILFAVAWAPLLFLFLIRFLRTGSPVAAVLCSVAAAMQLLISEPFTVLQTWGGVGVVSLLLIPSGTGRFDIRHLLRRFALIGCIGVGAALLAAVQLVPMLDHAADSARSRGLSFQDVAQWSLPPFRLFELVYPAFSGQLTDGLQNYWAAGWYPVERVPFLPLIYVGVLLAIPAVAGLIARVGPWKTVLGAQILLAILAAGSYTPLLDFLYRAGIFRSIRFPEKFALPMMMIVIVYGAFVLETLLSSSGSRARLARATVGAAAAGLLFSIVFLLASFLPDFPPSFSRFWRLDGIPAEPLAVIIGLWKSAWVWSIIRLAGLLLLLVALLRQRFVWTGVTLFLLVDVGLLANQLSPRQPAGFYDPPAVLSRLPSPGSDWRMFHQVSIDLLTPEAGVPVPESDRPALQWDLLMPFVPIYWGIHTILDYDIDETFLLPTRDSYDIAFGKLSEGDLAAFGKLLVLSNVRRYLRFDPRLIMVDGVGNQHYEKAIQVVDVPGLPRYYFATAVVPGTTPEHFSDLLSSVGFAPPMVMASLPLEAPGRGTVRSIGELPNRVRLEVSAESPALLVASITRHRYWSATINGVDAPLWPVNLAFQGVIVDGGSHQIELRYRNPLVLAGAWVSLLALVMAAGIVIVTTSRVSRASTNAAESGKAS